METMFTSLVRRVTNKDGLKQFQCNLTLALIAQAQRRATLKALGEIKKPRSAALVKQANVNTGPQQINNGSTAQSPAGSFQSESNKLLKANHGHWSAEQNRPS